MANDKAKTEAKAKARKSRGEGAEQRCLMAKAKRVAKSSGKPALEAYLTKNPGLKSYFASDIKRLMAKTWTPKPKQPKQKATPTPTTTET